VTLPLMGPIYGFCVTLMQMSDAVS
jgi:hypothetical protein